MSRRIARLELFKIVFESEMNNVTPKEILDSFIKRDEVILSENAKEFLVKFVEGISAHNSELNACIEKHMQGWELDRIGAVERAILKCGAYELKYETTGVEIIVNELVEIAKIYGDDKSFEFINGVLANINKER